MRFRSFYRQWKTADRTGLLFTCLVSFPMGAYTATIPTFMVFWIPAKRNGLEKVFVHCFLDGRDTPPASGKSFVAELEEKMKEIGVGKVASVMGRYYAMDRDKNWDRNRLAYDVMTKGEGKRADSAQAAIQASYDAEKFDEFVLPTVIEENGAPAGLIKDNDSGDFLQLPSRPRKTDHQSLL